MNITGIGGVKAEIVFLNVDWGRKNVFEERKKKECFCKRRRFSNAADHPKGEYRNEEGEGGGGGGRPPACKIRLPGPKDTGSGKVKKCKEAKKGERFRKGKEKGPPMAQKISSAKGKIVRGHATGVLQKDRKKGKPSFRRSDSMGNHERGGETDGNSRERERTSTQGSRVDELGIRGEVGSLHGGKPVTPNAPNMAVSKENPLVKANEEKNRMFRGLLPRKLRCNQ